MRIAPSFLTFHSRRPPFKTSAPEDRVDQIVLGPSLAGEAPLEAAFVSAQTGPFGPVLAEELDQLPCKFYRRRWLHWPWTSGHVELTSQEAAEAINQESRRLRVDWGDGYQRIRNSEQLAVLQHQLTPGQKRPLPTQAEELAVYQKRDPLTARSLSLYEAYQLVDKDQRVVLLEEGTPIGLAGSELYHPQGGWGDQVATTLDNVHTCFRKPTLEILEQSRLPSRLARKAWDLTQLVGPEEAAARFRTLQDSPDPDESLLAAADLNIFSSRPICHETLRAGHQAYWSLSDREGFKPGLALAPNHPLGAKAFFDRLGTSPLLACQEALPEQADLVSELFLGRSAREGLELSAELMKVVQADQVEMMEGNLPLGERVRTASALLETSHPQEFYRLWSRLTESGNAADTSRRQIVELAEACERGRRQDSNHYHWRYNLEPLLSFYQTELLAPDRNPIRLALVRRVARGEWTTNPLKTVLEPAASLSLGERVDLFESLVEEAHPEAYYCLVRDELESGSSLTQARQRMEEFALAAEQGRRYESNYENWRYGLKDHYDFYCDHLSRRQNEPARAFFLERLAAKQPPADVKVCLGSAGLLSPTERVELLRSLEGQPHPVAYYLLVQHELEAGLTHSQARQRMEEFAQAAEQGRRHESNYQNWRYGLESNFDFYREHFMGQHHEPIRGWFLERLAKRQAPHQVAVCFKSAGGLSEADRVAEHKRLQNTPYPNAYYELIRLDLEAGYTLEEARERMTQFQQAAQQNPAYESPHSNWRYFLKNHHQDYVTHLLEPEKEPVRLYFLERLAARSQPAVALGALKPAGTLSFGERVDILRSLENNRYQKAYSELIYTDLEHGYSVEQAVTRQQEFATAAESKPAYDSTGSDWRYRLKDEYTFYQDHLTALALAAVRNYFLELLTQNGRAAATIKPLLEPAGKLSLEARVKFSRQLGNGPYYRVAQAELEEGASPEQALRRVNALKEKLALHPDGLNQWRYHIKPALSAYQQAGPYGRRVILGALHQGQKGSRLDALLEQLQPELKKARDDKVDADELEALVCIENHGLPVESQIRKSLEALILKTSLASQREGDLDITEEEIWVNDIRVEVQD